MKGLCMKLFNLQSRAGMVGWSILISLILNFLISKLGISFLQNSVRSGEFLTRSQCNPFVENFSLVKIISGFPLKILILCASESYNFWLDFGYNVLFLAVVIFIVLSLIRYIKNKNSNH